MKTVVGIVGATFILVSLVLAAIALLAPKAPTGFVLAGAAVVLLIGIVLDRSADGKTCPDCAEKIKDAAKVCRYCGHKFTSV